MMSCPVSVILPTHNRSQVLRRSIRSVLSQTCSPEELIVVDDASSENIRDLLDEFQNPRIRYIRLDMQHGPGGARNAGVEIAKHEWIAFQDSDDEWLINKLELQWQAAQTSGADTGLVCGTYIIVPRKGRSWAVSPSQAMRSHKWPVEARFEFPFIAPTWLLKKRTFLDAGGFDTSLDNLEDWELSFRLQDHCGFMALDHPLLIKHGSEDGVNKDAARRVVSMKKIELKHKQLLSQSEGVYTQSALLRARLHARLGNADLTREAMQQAYSRRKSPYNRLLYVASAFGTRAFFLAQRLARALQMKR